MKRTFVLTSRKHGHKARLARQVRLEPLCRGVVPEASRLKTLVTCESGSYLWTTDRGRSRLVLKH